MVLGCQYVLPWLLDLAPGVHIEVEPSGVCQAHGVQIHT